MSVKLSPEEKLLLDLMHQPGAVLRRPLSEIRWRLYIDDKEVDMPMLRTRDGVDLVWNLVARQLLWNYLPSQDPAGLGFTLVGYPSNEQKFLKIKKIASLIAELTQDDLSIPDGAMGTMETAVLDVIRNASEQLDIDGMNAWLTVRSGFKYKEDEKTW